MASFRSAGLLRPTGAWHSRVPGSMTRQVMEVRPRGAGRPRPSWGGRAAVPNASTGRAGRPRAIGHPRVRPGGRVACRAGRFRVPQKLIWLSVSAIEFMNLLIDGAMPVEARKKPNSTATTAGPPLIDPPRISTTRTTPSRSTTDSEMATTDHTLGRSALPARWHAVGTHLRRAHRATNSPADAAG